MKYNVEKRPIGNLVNDINSKKISFNYLFQRKPGQWNVIQKTLLIDSALTGMLIPEIVLVNGNSNIIEYTFDGIEYVVDGVQRLDTFVSYKNDEFSLSKYASPITLKVVEEVSGKSVVTNKTFHVAGKKFSQLDEEIQNAFDTATLSVVSVIQYDNKEELKELFERWNSGSPLTPAQKLRSHMTEELIGISDKITESAFFTDVANFTSKQALKAEDQAAFVQSLMLISDFSYQNFTVEEMVKFLDQFAQLDTEMQTNLIVKLETAVERLSKLSDTKLKNLKKTSVPMVVYGTSLIESIEQEELYFYGLCEFFTNDESRNEYKKYNTVSTTKRSNVQGRIKIILSLAGIDYEVKSDADSKVDDTVVDTVDDNDINEEVNKEVVVTEEPKEEIKKETVKTETLKVETNAPKYSSKKSNKNKKVEKTEEEIDAEMWKLAEEVFTK